MENLPDWLVALIAAVFPAMQAPTGFVFNGYVEADYVYVAPANAGRIASISVDEGQRIFQGQQVYTLDSTQHRAVLAAAEARVEVAAANLENLQTGSRAQEIAVIRAELARAQAEQTLAAGNLERSEQLFERGDVAEARVDADRAAFASAQAQVAQLRAQLEVAELPARDAQLIAASATLDAAEADAAAARIAFENQIILAPISGRVEAVYFETGEVAGAGSPVFSILPDDTLRAIFFVPEPDRAEIRIGDTLTVSCVACGDGLEATVVRVHSSPQYTPPIIYSREERNRLVFRAEAEIGDGSGLLPGQPISLEVPQ
jgi:HlyD family secretion protein